jgi:lysylphosphatidylglycerol synthetase-like protein (DUF2156 family)
MTIKAINVCDQFRGFVKEIVPGPVLSEVDVRPGGRRQTEQIQTQPSSDEAKRDLIVERVRRFGSALSDAILDPLCTHFTISTIEGLIGYRVESSSAVVYGDPVCEQSNWPDLIQAFHSHCQKQGLNPIYVSTTDRFTKWAMRNGFGASVGFGEELVLDPHCDPRKPKGDNGHVVRRKVKHALKEGVEVAEYLSEDEKLEKAIEEAGAAWLQSRHGPQIYVAHVHLFKDPQGKRWFYANHGGNIIGVAQLSQLKARDGWLLSYLMHTPEAPHGTPELLLTSVLETLAKEGCSFITFGAVTVEELGEIQGLSRISSWIARAIFKGVNRFFHLDARRKFLQKFHPQNEPLFLLFHRPRIGLRELSALKRGLNVQLFKS